MTLMTIGVFCSCTKEAGATDAEQTTESKIVGTWTYERQYFAYGTYTVIFGADMSFSGQLGHYADSYGGTYALKDDILTFAYNDGYSISFSVQALTDSLMILHHYHSGHSYSLTKKM